MAEERKSEKAKSRSTQSDVRPTIQEMSFLDFQIAVGNEALNRLWKNSKKLKKKKDGKGGKRVHNLRVAFRRWYSVWEILSREGFESKSFKKEIGKQLKKAYKLLGAVRDWDVNLNTGKENGVPEQVLAKWQHERNRIEEESLAGVERLNLPRVIKKLSKHLKTRSAKLRRRATQDGHYNLRPRDAIEAYLIETEVMTRDLALQASTLEELHSLRLSIKSWRYILVEFFGYSSEPLVEAQQLLGQINDLERVRILLEAEDESLVGRTMDHIVNKQQDLISSLDQVKLTLPFGLRPADPISDDQNRTYPV